MNVQKAIILKPKKEESLKRFHPWVFSGAISNSHELFQEGEVVKVYGNDGSFLGIGHYQVGSIAVRILSFIEEEVDVAFYRRKIEFAYFLRSSIGVILANNNAFRLIHGEGDNLPGLIIDIYGNTAVIQAHSVGMHNDRNLIVEALLSVMPKGVIESVYYKSEGTLPYKANLENKDDYLYGGNNLAPIAIENGLKFNIDWLKGQKTGFFIDQRDNRVLLEKYAQDRNVLNLFCYTGAFSVYALRGGASKVVSVDSSSKAINLTDNNIELNFGVQPRHESSSEDAFKFLKQCSGDEFDLIILDPPAFAKHRGAINNALQGYKRLNHAAIEKIKSGGILFTFSCSQVISAEQFRLAVFSAAALSGRNVKILHRLTQPADHPINIYHPEGEYLKGLVLYIE